LSRDQNGRFVVPVTIDDLVANGLLGEAGLPVCWARSVETLMARKDDIAGLGVASDERIEACLLYINAGVGAESNAEAGPSSSALAAEIVSLRSFIEDDGARLKELLSRLGSVMFRLPRVHDAEISKQLLKTLGFRPVAGHRVYTARARSA
jgi:hypothetical protein